MSHELRTPLNAVIGFSDIMKEQAMGPLGSSQYVEFADGIHSSGRHLLGIIENILNVARIESNTEILCEEPIDAPAMVADCLQVVRPMAETGQVSLRQDIAADLPPFRGDTVKLKQILVNLLSNGVKFTPEGGNVEIRLGSAAQGGIEFVITDTGIGMAAEDVPAALAAFSQIDSKLERKYEGTGLGLPLAKMLTELHEGTLEIDSTPGKGTRVTVTLPAERILKLSIAAA